MPSLSEIPFLDRYRQREAQIRGEGLDELKQVTGVMTLQGLLQKQQREGQYRSDVAALGPNPTQEQLAVVGSKYAGAEKLLDIHQKSLDRKEVTAATAATNQARLEAQRDALMSRIDAKRQQADMMHEFRMTRLQTDADRAAETARHNQAVEGLTRQQNNIAAALRAQGLDIQRQGLDIQRGNLEIRRDVAGQGKALPAPLQRQLTEAGELADATQRFATTFKPEFGGKMMTGDLGNMTGRILGDSTGQSQWWQDYELHQSQVRNKLFGSALTAPEIEAWNKSAISPRMDSKQIQMNLQRRNNLETTAINRLMRGAAAGPYNRGQIEAFTGRPVPDASADPLGIR